MFNTKKNVKNHPLYLDMEESQRKLFDEQRRAFSIARRYNITLSHIASEVEDVLSESIETQSADDDYKTIKLEGHVSWPDDLLTHVKSAARSMAEAKLEIIDLKSDLQEKSRAIKDREDGRDYWKKQYEKLEKTLEGSRGDILKSTSLNELIYETTDRLDNAEDLYISVWTAAEQSFPKLLEALRKYSEKCLEDEFAESFDDLKALSYSSEEAKRISQYDIILRLYNDKIAKMRSQEMDEEDKDDAIQALRHLRDIEIQELTRPSDG